MRISDWSSDVCSSDLWGLQEPSEAPRAAWCQVGWMIRLRRRPPRREARHRPAAMVAATGETEAPGPDRKSVVSGKSVSVRVDIGGSRIIKKKIYNYLTGHE